jgi:hypothetical protein
MSIEEHDTFSSTRYDRSHHNTNGEGCGRTCRHDQSTTHHNTPNRSASASSATRCQQEDLRGRVLWFGEVQ